MLDPGSPDAVLWIFDGTKIQSRRLIIDTFENVIRTDPYLKARWQSRFPTRRADLEKIIDLWPPG